MRDSILLYRNQCDALRQLDAEPFKRAVLAIWDYAMDDTIPDGDPITMAMWHMTRPLIDQNRKRAEAGRIGGKANRSKQKQTESTDEANVKQIEAIDKQIEPKQETRNKKQEKIKDIYPYGEVVDYLNDRASTSFRSSSRTTRTHIKARFDEGYTLDDFRTVIDKKTKEWKGTDMAKYIRPETLFGSKFEAYLNQQDGKPRTTNRFNNFTPSTTDWDAVTAKIMEGQA